jgi:hypothetical protein
MSGLNFEEEARIQRQKINYFNTKVGSNDFDKAIDYLIITEWDEKKAVEMYLRLNKKRNLPQKNLPSLKKKEDENKIVIKTKKNLPPIKNEVIDAAPKRQINPNQNPSNITEINITEELLNNTIPYKAKDLNAYNNFLVFVGNKFTVKKNLQDFIISLKDHPGIIVILNLRKLEEFKKHIPKITNNFICPDINKFTIIFPIMSDSFIGNKLIKQFSCYNFPSYIFCKYDTNKKIKVNGKMEGVFNLNLFIDNVLKGLPDAKAQLKASLKTSLKKSILHSYNNDINDDDDDEDINQINNNNIKDSIAGLSDGQVMAKREQEMKRLEKEHENKIKKEQEEERKIKEEQERIKKRDEEYEKEAEKSKTMLPKEPDENDPNCCQIILRYPDGTKNIERRFNKNEKIENLYILVKSKGREIFFEQESNDFDLIYGFPPKNLDNSRNNTFDEEGLFPNAFVQIREK